MVENSLLQVITIRDSSEDKANSSKIPDNSMQSLKLIVVDYKLIHIDMSMWRYKNEMGRGTNTFSGH